MKGKTIAVMLGLGILAAGVGVAAQAEPKQEIGVSFELVPIQGDNVFVYGSVVDSVTGDVVVNATIRIDNGAWGKTNIRGYYFVETTLSAGTHTISCEAVGYEKTSKRFMVA